MLRFGRCASARCYNAREDSVLRTLGTLGLAVLQPQGAPGPESGAGWTGPLGLIRTASPEAHVVLGILVLFSIASWTIILYKLWTFQRAGRQSAQFLDVF